MWVLAHSCHVIAHGSRRYNHIDILLLQSRGVIIAILNLIISRLLCWIILVIVTSGTPVLALRHRSFRRTRLTVLLRPHIFVIIVVVMLLRWTPYKVLQSLLLLVDAGFLGSLLMLHLFLLLARALAVLVARRIMAMLWLILPVHQLLDNELIADGMCLVDDGAHGDIRFELEVVAHDRLGVVRSVRLVGAFLGRDDITAIPLVGSFRLGLHVLVASIRAGAGREAGHHLQLNTPIERLVVKPMAIMACGVRNKSFEILVVRFLVEFQLLAVLEVLPILHRTVFAKFRWRTCLFHSSEFFETGRFSSRVDVLPG